jgi:hypothetical protein
LIRQNSESGPYLAAHVNSLIDPFSCLLVVQKPKQNARKKNDQDPK